MSKLDTKKQIEGIMHEMIEQNLSEVNTYFYLHKRHEGKGLSVEGFTILYSLLCPVDSIYLAPSTFLDDCNIQ